MGSFNNAWHVIASSEDLPLRHIYHTRLLGQELAVWRDDKGIVNVWENRCPHRGVRLTLGVNLGDQLKCQYHGWKYESGSGHCAFVPAHRDAKPSSACVRTYQCKEVEGLVFTTLEQQALSMPVNALPFESAIATNLRSHPFPVDPQHALRLIEEAARSFSTVLRTDSDSIVIKAVEGALDIFTEDQADILRIFIQPESGSKAVVHARLYTESSVSLQRRIAFTQVLSEINAGLKQDHRAQTYTLIASDTIPGITTQSPLTRNSAEPFSCTVIARNTETPDIDSFWLKAEQHHEWVLEPGMHLSLMTPSGHLRQYSIVNTPDERDVFVIGVKHELKSRGGSRSMHKDVQVGTKVMVTIPKNQFALQPPGRHAILIAGGIGVTPILAMALHLEQARRPYSFHYLARGHEHLAFKDRLPLLGNGFTTHLGLDVDSTKKTIANLMGSLDVESHEVYVCGPQPMIELVVAIAKEIGFPTDHVHYEYFGIAPTAALPAAGGVGYQVVVQSTGREFSVKPGQSLLQACLDQGLNIDYSCEQGVCGACVTKVVSGEPQHADVYLSAKEKASGKLIMPCVSGCKSKNLVLDI